MAFTDRTIAALKPKPKRYEVWEGGGFGVRVGTSGKRAFVGVYHFAGKARRVTYGAYPEMSLAGARVAHAKAKEALKKGIDPGDAKVAENTATREAETVEELAREYIERHARRKKRSAPQDERALNREVIPTLGARKAQDIKRRDLIVLLDKIEARGSPVMRNRTASLLGKMFMFAISRGIVDASPAVGIERLAEKPRDRVYTADEIRAWWAGLDAAPITPAVRLALKFCLVTGQRRGEVAGIAWEEIDREDALWNLPGERTKNGRPNIIPLPPLAMRLVEQADELRIRKPPEKLNRADRPEYDPTPSQWLFPSHKIGAPLLPTALTRAANRHREALGIGDATVHDLRRTYATVHGEIGTSPEVLKALLNHTPREITERVYALGANIGPRRKAMEAWCNWLEQVIAGKSDADNIVRLMERRVI
jgi:integrase